ncbi:hypothetical protein E2C01_016387 [Portunus trituberculatus]|uniref:Uncharacterized protein n=1 Tax=Portunus trituberculatus TaxID=210409 RepID=A0A5B7DQS0_PORTR|nr:hypothetical protein [Portunus trituberculatus]
MACNKSSLIVASRNTAPRDSGSEDPPIEGTRGCQNAIRHHQHLGRRTSGFVTQFRLYGPAWVVTVMARVLPRRPSPA